MGPWPGWSSLLSSAVGLTVTLGVLSPVLTVARGVPQAFRSYRSDAVGGVSEGTWLLLMAVAELWLAYGLLFDVPAETAANVPNALLATSIAVRVAILRGSLARGVASVALLSAAAAAVALTGLDKNLRWVLSVVAVGSSLGLYLPQLARVLRDDDVAGISTATWLLALLNSISWGAYGLLIHNVPVWLPSAVLVPSSAMIVLRVLRRRSPG